MRFLLTLRRECLNFSLLFCTYVTCKSTLALSYLSFLFSFSLTQNSPMEFRICLGDLVRARHRILKLKPSRLYLHKVLNRLRVIMRFEGGMEKLPLLLYICSLQCLPAAFFFSSYFMQTQPLKSNASETANVNGTVPETKVTLSLYLANPKP